MILKVAALLWTCINPSQVRSLRVRGVDLRKLAYDFSKNENIPLPRSKVRLILRASPEAARSSLLRSPVVLGYLLSSELILLHASNPNRYRRIHVLRLLYPNHYFQAHRLRSLCSNHLLQNLSVPRTSNKHKHKSSQRQR